MPLPANAFVAWSNKANVQWSGPGYYAWHTLKGIYAGPFSDEADCNAAVAANAPKSEQALFECANTLNEADIRQINWVETVGWSGPGYYVSDQMPHGISYVHGPLSSTEACKAGIAANIQPASQSYFGCDYVSSAQEFDSNTQPR